MSDVIIIGAGPAGLSAALWCDELGLKTIVLEAEEEIGGQLLRVYNRIENHLGTVAADGRELRDKFAVQVKSRNFDIRTNARATSVDLSRRQIVLAQGDILSARSLILATGVRRRKLNIPGEDEFRGRGILESGKRDVDMVEGKKVCVIGGGDAACENALILAETAERVYLVHRRPEFRARSEFTEQIKQNPRIEILPGTEIVKISGGNCVSGVESKKIATGGIYQLPVEAVLIRIGVEPNSELFAEQIEFDKQGYIVVNSLCRTSLENVYAIGDVANPLAPTVSSAVGMGATAAKVLIETLKDGHV